MKRFIALTAGMTMVLVGLVGTSMGVELKLDSKKALVPIEEIMSGGPPPDGIPAIDNPIFVSVKEADEWLKDREPVIAFQMQGDYRAYPLQVITWHEIVNDVVGGHPVAITFCPLCASALAFGREYQGKLYDFGTSGMLYKSNLVMYDRQTKSLWAQITGQAIVGDLAGARLKPYPAGIISWRQWKQAYPQGKVLSRKTGYRRPYGRNPYVGYDRIDQPPFLFRGKLDNRLSPMERVAAIQLGKIYKAYPFQLLTKKRVVNDLVNGQPLVVFFQSGTASALDKAEIASSRDVGAVAIFDPRLDGRRLTFSMGQDAFVDKQTGSLWDIFGRARKGPLKGKTLTRLTYLDTFWFAWAAFQPETIIFR